MRKSNFALRLQPALLDEARKLADTEGVALNQLINVAVAEKLSALRTDTYLRERAARASIPKAMAILKRAGAGNPPLPGDELRRPTRSIGVDGNPRERADAAPYATSCRGAMRSGTRVRPPSPGGHVLFPTDLPSFLELIRQHGDLAYSLMFAYAASHSLLMALFAGYAAHAGVFAVEVLIAVCWLGSLAGDAIRFWIGRRFGTRWLDRLPRLQLALQTAARLAERHHVWMILLHRYPHGIRGVAGFAYGMSELRWPAFLALNFAAAGLWSVAVVSVGYAFGQVSDTVMRDASSQLGLLTLVAFLGLSWFLSKRLERAAAER
jgi:membrane protein DedA with SNARE-associated domain